MNAIEAEEQEYLRLIQLGYDIYSARTIAIATINSWHLPLPLQEEPDNTQI